MIPKIAARNARVASSSAGEITSSSIDWPLIDPLARNPSSSDAGDLLAKVCSSIGASHDQQTSNPASTSAPQWGQIDGWSLDVPESAWALRSASSACSTSCLRDLQFCAAECRANIRQPNVRRVVDDTGPNALAPEHALCQVCVLREAILGDCHQIVVGHGSCRCECPIATCVAGTRFSFAAAFDQVSRSGSFEREVAALTSRDQW